tara:strand:- start:411 stop:881 length:471 start_codon:yes stop_codon:yes gene_type:complete
MLKDDQNLIHLKAKVESAKNKNSLVGFTNGCFDLLHDGHKHLLINASKMCDFLIVGLNSNKSVKILKGLNRPIQDVDLRLKNLNNLPYVDEVVVFEEETPEILIMNIMPDVIIKGADYENKKVVGETIIKSNGGIVKLVSLIPGVSTSNIIRERNL